MISYCDGEEGRIEKCPSVVEDEMEQLLESSKAPSGFSSVYASVSQRRPESERLLNSMKFSEREDAAL